MENLAYLHAASVYEDLTNSEIISVSSLFDKAVPPDWNRLSGKAWKYMLPLALILSVLNVYGSALALEQGDKGPSVRNLQRELKRTGFYQAPITQVYDVSTEQAVRRFQKAAGLEVTGVAGPVTIQKLDGWETTEESSQNKKPSVESSTAKKPTSQNTQAKKPNAETAQAKKPSSQNSQAKKTSVENSQAEKTSGETVVANKRRDANLLQRGDEGEDVKTLQERLRVAGFYHGNSTGIYGPITEDAVKRFQENYNLTVDGIVGAATQRRLPPRNIGSGEDTTRRGTSQDKLRLGDSGEAVRVLQEQLIKAGYLQGEPNGYFGPYTADAVKRFQANNYLAVSGIAGPTTRSKLHDLVSPSAKSDFDTLEIQRRLQSRGLYKGDLNGVMGDETKQAIKQAQEFYGISLRDVRSGRF
ncbi:cell wall-binding protein [Scytonema hofmannii PCC 7110]|uniref:Cell wall-binding protein n=1 Tax=Scytonema hofmannii PCC 7110 TaxID=128403 RepID=A0A139WTH5_9CYAN|nr:peptidoglycan-binding protein [Scytonema hofmannii]KYC35720.1 cell wall-binding protein [Scytonema hofmannii PCC 7110]